MEKSRESEEKSVSKIGKCPFFLSFMSKTLWTEQKGLLGPRDRESTDLTRKTLLSFTELISGRMCTPKLQDSLP